MLADQPMRDSMIQLAGFLGRRRRWVLGAWIVVLVLALPLAAKQTEHLTGGGFDVPGSQSKAVSDALKDDFGGRSRRDRGPARGRRRRASRRSRRRGRAGSRRRLPTVGDVTLPPPAARRAEAQLQGSGKALVPLRSDADLRRADRLRRRTARSTSTRAPPRPGSPPTSPVSRRSGPGCRSSPRRTWRRRRRAASRSSP